MNVCLLQLFDLSYHIIHSCSIPDLLGKSIRRKIDLVLFILISWEYNWAFHSFQTLINWFHIVLLLSCYSSR